MAHVDKSEVTGWELQYPFDDAEGNPITCGETTCTIGSYLVSRAENSEQYSPACTTCEFTGGLGDVFNPDEPRYEPGAPECFKKAAAAILTSISNSPLETGIRIGRPDTAKIIDSYADKTTD